MNLRQQQQQAFDRSGEPLIVGNVSHCPLPPEPLAALGPDSPMWCRYTAPGLTGEVYRLRIAGKEYNLKETSRRRRRCQPQRPAVVFKRGTASAGIATAEG